MDIIRSIGVSGVLFIFFTGLVPCVLGYETCFVLYPNGTSSIEQCENDLVCCDNYDSDQICCYGGISPVVIVVIVCFVVILKIITITCCYLACRRRQQKRRARHGLYEPGPSYGAPPPGYNQIYNTGAYPAEVGAPPPYTEK